MSHAQKKNQPKWQLGHVKMAMHATECRRCSRSNCNGVLLGEQFLEPFGGILWCSLLRCEVHIGHTEAAGESIFPFQVVEERPCKCAFDGDSRNSFGGRRLV